MDIVKRTAKKLKVTQLTIFRRAYRGKKTRGGWIINPDTMFARYCVNGKVSREVEKTCRIMLEEYKQPELNL